MAKHRLLVEDVAEVTRVGNALGTHYWIEDGALVLRWKSGYCRRYPEVGPGDFVVVDCWGGFPDVRMLRSKRMGPGPKMKWERAQ